MRYHHEDGLLCLLCADKLKEAHPTIAEWFIRVKARYVNVHISCAFRNAMDQNKMFRDGKSKCAWPDSKHNHLESGKPCAMALDLFLIDEDGLARFPPLFYAKLNADNERDLEKIKWGGQFEKFFDGPHYEMI